MLLCKLIQMQMTYDTNLLNLYFCAGQRAQTLKMWRSLWVIWVWKQNVDSHEKQIPDTYDMHTHVAGVKVVFPRFFPDPVPHLLG